jgi:hypothetical protein
VTFLSRLAFLGGAKETVNGTPVAPAFTIPFSKAQYDTIFVPIRDETVRANDVVLQGLYQGPADGTFDIETHFYPDLAGFFLRMIGPDTVTNGQTTTTTGGGNTAGSTSLTTAAPLTTGAIVQIGTGATQEWLTVTTGGTPNTVPALKFTHPAADPVIAQYTHTFTQSSVTRPPSYTLSVFDNIDYRTFAGAMMTDLSIKIDPKGSVSMNPKFVTWPEATAASFVPTFNVVQPQLGWQWTVTNAGGVSTRGLTMDFTIKRTGEAIHTGNGLQTPRETFVGALEVDGAYKAIYENTTDMSLYLQYTQTPTVHSVIKPVSLGGESLVITMSQSGYHKAVRDLSQQYVQATFDVSAVNNSTDGGITKVVLKNYVSAAY